MDGKLMFVMRRFALAIFAATVGLSARADSPNDFPGVKTWKFYEEADDKYGLNLAAWDGGKDVPFWIGAGVNMAIPVDVLLYESISASDVVLVSGTYSDYKKPQVVTDKWLFDKHYTALKNAVGFEPYGTDHGPYGWVFDTDKGDRNYSLSLDIWPEKKVVPGRHWILFEMGGRPTKGCKTFYLGLKGRDGDGYSRFRLNAIEEEDEYQDPSDWSDQLELAVLPAPIGGGTTSGSGMYVSGKQVTLSAKPSSGHAFEGWYDPDNGQLLGKEASFKYVTTGADKTIFAKFVTTDEDAASLKVVVPDDSTDADGSYELNLVNCVKSLTVPKLAVTGLPAGLKYDAKTMSISGKATKPGVYTVKVAATNASVKKATDDTTGTFELTVPNFTTQTFIDAGLDTTNRYVLAAGAAPDLSGVFTALAGAGWKLAVSGLPAGLKYDAKAGAITGVATKDGIFTVTFTATSGKYKEVAMATFKVAFPVLTLMYGATGDEAATGTVSGGGLYPAGKKVALKATPAKGSIFVGWYDANDGLISNAASFSYESKSTDETLTAKFATEAEDAASLKVVVSDDSTEADGSYELDLGNCVESLTVPKLAVTGLPAGLKYDAKTMTIGGKATKPGVYTVKVAATNTSVKKATDGTTKTFKITVPNFSTPVLPNLKSAPDAYGVIRVGVEYSSKDIIDFSPVDTGWTVSVSGLPAGLTYKNGVVSGIPKKAGCYTVTVTAKRGKETQVATITFNVEALPSWVVGKFYGPLDCRGVNVPNYISFQNNPQAYKYWDWECPGMSEITISSDGKVSIVCREVNNSVSSTVNTRLFLADNGDYCIEEAMVAKGNTFERYYGFKVTKLPGFDLGFITGNEMGVDSDEDAYFSEWTAYQDAYTANPAGLPLPEFGSGANVTIPADVKSNRFPGRYENGYLTLKFGANGAVTPSWVGYGNYKMIKTRLLPFAVDGEGAVYANICVLGADYSRERGFGLFYTLCIPVTNDGVADVSNIKYTLDKVMMDDW